MIDDLCFGTASQLVRAVANGDVSAAEVMRAHLQQIDEHNSKVNAIVTLTPERALDAANEADRARARGEVSGPLAGLPIAHKDLTPTQGVRTTYGSRSLADFVPEHNSLLVERIQAAGAVMLGKTNTPEFGAGSQTFNEVFGATRNPYDLTKTCGGSSGGAAVALATGMVPIADGSDMGGSLRNPAAFCNVVGFRPSPGRVPMWPTDFPWSTLVVEGPMARTVEDVALLLSAIAGPDDRSPIALAEPGEFFRGSLRRDFKDVRIAFSPDFGDQVPVQPEIVDAISATLPLFEQLGCLVESATPDFRDADFAFKTWRAWLYAGLCGPVLEEHRDQLKDTLIWNIEEGLKLSGNDLLRADRARSKLFHRMRLFMQSYDFLVLPVTQVAPFDVETPYVTEINGESMETYLDWMRSCYYITITGQPAISVPCGFTKQGLPVGVQIVGRMFDDWGVLQLAYAFQEVTGYWQSRPPMVVGLKADQFSKGVNYGYL